MVLLAQILIPYKRTVRLLLLPLPLLLLLLLLLAGPPAVVSLPVAETRLRAENAPTAAFTPATNADAAPSINLGILRGASRDYLVRNWSVDHGLPVNFIADMIQSREGYLWLTTYDGIARFDGINFRIYNASNTPNIPNNRFRYVAEDASDYIWFTNDYGGVWQYRRGQSTYFTAENGFTDGIVLQKPFETEDGVIFSTSDGLFAFRDGQFRNILRRNTPSANWFKNVTYRDKLYYAATRDGLVVTDADGNARVLRTQNNASNEILEIGLLNGTVYAFNEDALYQSDSQGVLVLQTSFPELTNAYIHRIYSDAEVMILVSGVHVIVAYADGRRHRIRLPIEPGADDFGYHIDRTSEGRIYIGTIRGHYFEILGQQAVRFNPGGHFNNVVIETLFTDLCGNVWVRTNSGLYSVNEPSVRTFGSKEGLLQDNMLALFEDSRGNFWAGMRMSGINLMRLNGNIEQIERLVDTRFEFSLFLDTYAFLEREPGEIWAAVEQYGIAVFLDEQLNRVVNLGEAWRVNEIRSLAHASGGDIWAGTMGGLVLLSSDGVPKQHYTTHHGLRSDKIQFLRADAQGNLWIATAGGGVSYFDGTTFTNFQTTDGLPSNSIRAIHIDHSDPETLWFGTEGRGLTRFRNGQFSTINQPMGLFDDHIHSIIEDQTGRLWMSTNRGVFYISKDDAHEVLAGRLPKITSTVFTKDDGMRSEEANGGFQNSALLRSDGFLFYATQAGISIFQTDYSGSSRMNPIPHVEGISAGGETWYGGAPVELGAGNNDFAIRFTGFEYRSPDRIMFRYKLEGYDRDWQYAGTNREARYTNMPPGSYTFHVSTRNTDQSWGVESASIALNILPHVYEQTWFWMLMVLLFGGALYSGFEWKMMRVQRRELELEEKIRLRTADLCAEKDAVIQKQHIIEKQSQELYSANQTKDKFFTMIAHDLRSPFSGIMGILEYLHQDFENMDDETRRTMISTLLQSSENVYQLLEDLLSWAELQKGGITPNPESLDAESLVYEVLETLRPMAANKRIRLETHFQSPLTLLADRQMLQSILRNVISNAIKFSFPTKRVTIRAWTSDDYGYIAITDSGIGMSEPQVKALFLPDKATSTKGTSNETGSGLGLLICNELARVQHMNINAFSELGKGTVLTLEIPLTDQGAVDYTFVRSRSDSL